MRKIEQNPQVPTVLNARGAQTVRSAVRGGSRPQNVDAKYHVKFPRRTEFRVSKVSVVKVSPLFLQGNGRKRKITSHGRYNDGCDVKLLIRNLNTCR